MDDTHLVDDSRPVGLEDYGWSDSVPCSCNWLAPQIRALVQTLKLRNVVDVGAGNGALCAMINEMGCRIVGVEPDREGYDIARRTYPDIPFYHFGVQSDPSELMRRESPFDAVISTEVVEHLFSPHLLPRYAREILRSSGYLIVSTPYHGYVKNLALSVLGKWDFHHTPLWHGGHIKFWSRRTLSSLLEQHGFEVIGFHGVGRLPLLWKSMILVARKV